MTPGGVPPPVGDDRGDAQGRSATLLVRVWSEAGMPGVPRARLLTVVGQETATWATLAGETAIARGVLDWLRSTSGMPGRPAHPPPSPRAAGAPVPPLVDGDWLEQHLDDPGVVVVVVAQDRSASDRPPDAVPDAVPGARRVHWSDLHDPVRRAVLGSGAFAVLMDSLGIGQDAHVVLCDEGSGGLAAAAAWSCAYYGHRRTSLLDGGLVEWQARGRPTGPPAPAVTGSPHPRAPGSVPGHPPGTGYVAGPGREDLLLTRDQLLVGFVGAPAGTAVVDCRSPQEFAGHPGAGAGRGTGEGRVLGHVPGAVNVPVDQLLVPGTGRLLPRADLGALVARHGLAATDHVVVYCGIGDRSPLVWFALHEVLGWPEVRCYTGAWAEYGSLTDVPVAVG